jgi:hypothetical protein
MSVSIRNKISKGIIVEGEHSFRVLNFEEIVEVPRISTEELPVKTRPLLLLLTLSESECCDS